MLAAKFLPTTSYATIRLAATRVTSACVVLDGPVCLCALHDAIQVFKK